jgi:hypothetical protein
VPDAPATQVARYRDAVVDRREDLRGKYLRLGSGELTAAVLFAVLAFTAVTPQLTGQDDKAALWSALVPLIVVLVQAGAYWLLARSWVERAPMPPAVARLYRAFRTADPVMLAAGLVGILLWLPDRSEHRPAGGGGVGLRGRRVRQLLPGPACPIRSRSGSPRWPMAYAPARRDLDTSTRQA